MKTNKLLLLILTIFTAVSCKENVEPNERNEVRYTDKIELRQLENSIKTEKYARASYFLISASYSENRTQTDVVKVFGKVGDSYRLLEFDMKDVRIVLNDTIKKPYIKIQYTSVLRTTEELLYHDYYIDSYYIYCSEQYLPERLLPIEIK